MTENEKEERKTPRITEVVTVVSVMVTILIAGTSLLSNTANIPWWWFHFSFIILIALTFFIPSVIFYKPISERVNKWRLKGKRNAVARKHFAEFKDFVDGFGRASYDIFGVLDRLRGHLEPKIREKMGIIPIRLLQVHNRNDVESPIYHLKERLRESNKTFRELTLLTEQFNIVLEICEKTQKLVSEFGREIKEEYEVPEHIKREYDEARERYNDFIKHYNRYCHKLNQELEENIFSEHFDLAKKW